MKSNTDKLEELVPKMYKNLPIDQAYNELSDNLNGLIIHLRAIKDSMEELTEKMEEMVDKI